MFSFIFCLTLSLAGYTADDVSMGTPVDSVKRPPKNKALADSSARFIRINRIFIVGNRITRDRIILRELSLKQGDLIYSSDIPGILELDKKKLINTRLFNNVSIRTLELETNQYDLLVDLKERWYTFPSPIFDLADRNFNEWWENYNHDFKRVNYGLRLYQFNMRGRNETLRFVAQFGYLRRFDLSYRIPNLDRNQKHGLAFDFDFSEAKNVAFRTTNHKLEYLESENVQRITRGGGVTYLFRNSFYQTHSLKLEYRHNSISDSLLEVNDNYLGGEGKTSQQFGVLTYSFTSDRRDYIAYPLRGYYFNGNIVRSGLTENDDLSKTETTLTFAKYFDLKKDFFLSNNIVAHVSTPNNLPYFNYGALGYRKQFIRGYEVYVIEGPMYVMNKTTFKKKIFSRHYHWSAMPIEQFRDIPLSVYLKTYADFGFVTNYDNYIPGKPLTDKLLSGVGGGVDIIGSYDMVLRFEYTFNAEGERGFFFHIRKEF
jgi:outer membrane protein assembly factor BamA